MQKINLFKMVRRWQRPKHSSSSRYSDTLCRSSCRMWHSFRHRSSSSHWDFSESDSDDEYCGSTPRDVPAGCLVVYVGEERRRYVIGAQCLNHPLFKALLERSAEEYGFHHDGGLTIACEIIMFEHLLRIIANNGRSTRCVEDLADCYASSEALDRPLL